MTPQEFKAWFDGFTEAIDKAPTLKQWARIKERVGEIDGQAVTERIFIDRYQRYVGPHWNLHGPQWYFTAAGTPTITVGNTCQSGKTLPVGQSTTSNTAMLMNAVGAAEAKEMVI